MKNIMRDKSMVCKMKNIIMRNRNMLYMCMHLMT